MRITTGHPLPSIVRDDQGVLRFQRNDIVPMLVNMSLVRLGEIFATRYPISDHRQVAQLTGITLDEYEQLSCAACDRQHIQRIRRHAEHAQDPSRTRLPIQTMRSVYPRIGSPVTIFTANHLIRHLWDTSPIMHTHAEAYAQPHDRVQLMQMIGSDVDGYLEHPLVRAQTGHARAVRALRDRHLVTQSKQDPDRVLIDIRAIISTTPVSSNRIDPTCREIAHAFLMECLLDDMDGRASLEVILAQLRSRARLHGRCDPMIAQLDEVAERHGIVIPPTPWMLT